MIWDSGVIHSKDEEITTVVKPIAHIFAYMLRELAHDKEKEMYPNEFTHERISESGVNVQSGDTGVFFLKYIECHAKCMTFSS